MRKPAKRRAPGVRDQLLAAARKLSQRHPLSRLKPAMIAAAAGHDAAEFARHFPSLTDCLLAVQQEFMEDLRNRVLETAVQHDPGYPRIKAGSIRYLDTCLENRALRGWLIEARGRAARINDHLRRQNHTYHLFLAPEFKAMGWPRPAAAAQIYLAMLMEASQVEHARERATREVRDSLWDFLKTC